MQGIQLNGGRTKVGHIQANLIIVVTTLGWALSAWAQSDDAIVGSGGAPIADCPIALGNRGDATPYSSEPFDCHCAAEARKMGGGYAYGSSPYDGISNICMAALHAGAIGLEGGEVHVVPGPSQENYKGSLANGVFSSDWDYPSQFGSFIVEPLVEK